MEVAIADEQQQGDDECRSLPDFTDTRAPRILQLLLEGCTYEQIAAELKISIRTVYNIRRDEQLDAIADQLTTEGGHATIRAYMAMRRKAFQVATKHMDAPDPTVSLVALDKALRYVAVRESVANEPTDAGRQANRPERGRDELVRRARAALAKRSATGGG